MSIDKVSSFLFARSYGSQAQTTSKSTSEESDGARVADVAQEAAVISKKSGFLYEMSERRLRVDELKAQVQSGTYQQPNSEAVAKSFILDTGLV